MSASLFNDEQLAYMAELSEMPAETKCWCGWYRGGECYNCTRDPRVADKTCADKLALACPTCGSVPDLPDTPPYHKPSCTRYPRL